MATALTCLLATLAVLSGTAQAGKRGLPDSCTSEYAAMETSTMCEYYDDPDATNCDVSALDRQLILDEHNRYRAAVSPTATNMLKTYWDEEIAVIAQKYANVCPGGHDTNAERKVPGYGISIGQNLAWGYGDWSAAIEGWHSEVADFTYAADNDLYKVGHYTQVVNSNAIRIGCGYADCPRSTYVCNYAFGQSNIDEPYTAGDSCADCPNSCSDNLCDCGDIICKNSGVLNLETCTCECQGVYTGDTCAETDCPMADPSSSCDWYGEAKCTVWSNVPLECPIMCGICPEVCPGSSADDCKNGGVLNSDCACDCPDDYSGDQCQTAAECPGPDVNWCPNIPDWWCQTYSNMETDCPKRCGFC